MLQKERRQEQSAVPAEKGTKKTALFSLLWGKKCGFCAKPRKKQLRNRRIYAIT